MDDPFYNPDLKGFDIVAYVKACVVATTNNKKEGEKKEDSAAPALGDTHELPAVQQEHQYIVIRWAMEASDEVGKSTQLRSRLTPIFGMGRQDFTPRNCEEMRVFIEAMACVRGKTQEPLAERHDGVDSRLATLFKDTAVKDNQRVDAIIATHVIVPRQRRHGGGGGGSSSDAERFAPLVGVTIDFDPHATLVALQAIDQSCGWNRTRASRMDANSGYDAVFTDPEDLPSIPSEVRKDVMAAYALMLTMLHHPRIKSKYGYTSQDHKAANLTEGGSVPSYFANVGGESIFRRKLLSTAGLRNLVIYGPTIYTQLREKLFASNPQVYSDGSGIALMRNMTGNVVDLDWTVLRCSDRLTMETINMSNRHKNNKGIHDDKEDGLPFPLPVYNDITEFGNSLQAKQIAHNNAANLLTQFAKQIGIDGDSGASARTQRNIDLSQLCSPNAVPVATDNSNRGVYPMWRYQNCGQDSYHVNVPNMEQVNGALLRAPFHCVQYWLHIIALFCPASVLKRGYRSDWSMDLKIADDDEPTEEQRQLLSYQALLTDSERTQLAEFELRVDSFFEQCIVDSCFNMKWKAIEEFGESLSHEGSIVDILQRAQMNNQHIFTGDFFDADDEELRTNEIEAMWDIAKGMVGKSKADGGALREITKEDVRAWVLDPSLAI
eukprot:TRINITY_DN16943_c0_g1_i3.p1 TRINITY_DN16943_c0_g1~~TRINITY_DN16943_c0_g1_i3.p1  ORF type:complete len:663 (-),score=162.22 TRINITY_DN16943_c0_g1_i3:156-2144(-)